MAPHERRPDSPVDAPENPEIQVALERNPEVLASNPDEDLVPGSYCRGIPRGPP